MPTPTQDPWTVRGLDLSYFTGKLEVILRANARAVAASDKRTRYRMHGVEWSEYTKPFRLWCLAELQREFAGLDSGEQARVTSLLGEEAIPLLTDPLPCEPETPPALPIPADREVNVRDSWMR